MWTPDPAPPFEVLVIAPGGIYMKPVRVERLTDNVVELVVEPMVRELVTVSGSAGSTETTPAAGLPRHSHQLRFKPRTPANLIQALENVPASTTCLKVRLPSLPPRSRARTHADSPRWRAGVLGTSCRSERDVSRSRRDRRDRSGSWTRIGCVWIRRVRRRHFRPDTECRAARSLWRAFFRHAGRGVSRSTWGAGALRALSGAACFSLPTLATSKIATGLTERSSIQITACSAASRINSVAACSPPAGKATSAATSNVRATIPASCASTIRRKTPIA